MDFSSNKLDRCPLVSQEFVALVYNKGLDAEVSAMHKI